jgi:VWFA-related protein
MSLPRKIPEKSAGQTFFFRLHSAAVGQSRFRHPPGVFFMKPFFGLLLSLAVFLNAVATAQTPNPPTPPPDDDDSVVRITSSLVQVDAVVTDRDGRHVTDLKPEDFEILEDGKRQDITNFSYVAIRQPGVQPAPLPKSATPNGPAVPPARLDPTQVKRTIAFVVDDLTMSFQSVYYTREALRKFVNTQMQPGDLLAIVRAGAGMGALQQFTNDKRILLAAIERIRQRGLSDGLPVYGATDPDGFDQFRKDVFTVGTLGAVDYVVRGLRELPGRKSVVLVSDGFRLVNSNNQDNRVLDAFRRLTDLANRSSTVIYTMDARGLQTVGPTAADAASPGGFGGYGESLRRQSQSIFDTQAGLIALAKTTGGFAVRNSNDLFGGLRRIIEDQQGYYLLAYSPDDASFRPGRNGRAPFHNLKIVVKRPGLTVRARTGFYGLSDAEAVPPAKTGKEQLIRALTSPFNSAGVRVRLTSLFASNPQVREMKTSGIIKSLLYFDTRDLTFTDDGEWKQAVIDILAVTFGDNGVLVEQTGRTQTIRLKGDTYKAAMENGLVFTVDIPVKKPGAYQFRIALRDSASERVGSGSQFIEVPDLGKQNVALSGLFLTGLTVTGGNGKPVEVKESESPKATPAVREFEPGQGLSVSCFAYNPRLEGNPKQPFLTTEMKIFKDGKEIFTGGQQRVAPGNTNDFRTVGVVRGVQLPPGIEPGEYVLQVIVTDQYQTDAKRRTISQWIDFTVAPKPGKP